MGEWWPVAAFGWLLASRFAIVWIAPVDDVTEKSCQLTLWALSLVGYLLGVLATAILPIPELGIDAAARAGAAIPGGGLWVERPQTVIAFGAGYFTWLAWIKSLPLGGVSASCPTARPIR